MTENEGTDPRSEQQRREAALDETIEQSLPASDPPSSDPNPDSHSAITSNVMDDDTEETEGRIHTVVSASHDTGKSRGCCWTVSSPSSLPQ
jgi:hypothetical protein